MSSKPPESDVRNIWQEQRTEVRTMSVETMQATATQFQKRVYRRNVREYVAAVIVVILFGSHIWNHEGLYSRAGAALIILATLNAVFQLYVRGKSQPVQAEMGLNASLRFHRQELVRQRNFSQGVWLWHLLPFLPGLVVTLVGRVLEDPSVQWANLRFMALVVVVILVGLTWLNKRGARKLQLKIDELDELEGET
jgi:hypothetical protein